MEKTNIVQIRKKGGLDKIVKEKNTNSTVHPMLYRSKDKTKEGTLEGDYKGKTLLDTKHFISPMWDDLKKRWAFDGSAPDLSRLIDKMKLRYPKKHPKSGQMVKASDIDSNRLTNIQDDVFNHPDLYGKYFMENGRISLNLSDPRQEFLYLCYRGSSSVEDRGSDKVISKYVQAGSKYELVSPRKEAQAKKRDADKDVTAIKLLAAMDQDEDRMRAVATIMDLPQYAPTTDAAGLFVLLKDMAAENRSFSSKYNKTYQDRFIELASLSDDDLNVSSQVILGKNKGILRKRPGFYLFNGEKVDGIDNDLHLINYFRNPKNQEDYLKLVHLLEDER